MPGNSVKNDNDVSLYPDISVNFVSEDTLDAGNTPLVLDVFGTLATKVGNRGHIANDGSGTMTVAISTDGSNFNTPWSLKPGEMYDLTGMNIKQIQLTRGAADSDYRVMVW